MKKVMTIIAVVLFWTALVLATGCKKEAIDRDKKDTTGWNVK